MKKEIWSAFAVTLFLVAMGASAAEHLGHGGPGMRGFGDPDRMIETMTRKLELDETQAQSVRNIIDAARPAMDEMKNKAMANRKAIGELDVNDPDYGTKLQNLSEENGYLASQATQLFGQLRADIASVLTPEQQQKLSEGMHNKRDRSSRGHRRHDQPENTEQ